MTAYLNGKNSSQGRNKSAIPTVAICHYKRYTLFTPKEKDTVLSFTGFHSKKRKLVKQLRILAKTEHVSFNQLM